MYSATLRQILAWGDQANTRQSEECEDIFYINNVFTELNVVHRKKKYVSDNEYEYDVHADLVQYAVEEFLSNVLCNYQVDMGGVGELYLPPHFAFFVPTDWGYKIREKVIRPLFIRAKLINETDHNSRLLFFTQLETTFQYLQLKNHTTDSKMNMPIVNGQQYMIYGLKFTANTLSVRLDLFSAHYPSINSIGSNYITKPLQSIHFTTSLDSDMEKGIVACIINRGFDTQTIKTKRILHELIKKYKKHGVKKFLLFSVMKY